MVVIPSWMCGTLLTLITREPRCGGWSGMSQEPHLPPQEMMAASDYGKVVILDNLPGLHFHGYN